MVAPTFPVASVPFGSADAHRSLSIAEAMWLLGLSYYAVSTPNISLAVVGDTLIPIPLPIGFANYLVDSAYIVNPSGLATPAKIGLFTQPAGAGVAIIPAGTSVTVSTAAPNTAGNTQQITPSTGNTQSFNAPTLYFRVTTAALPASATATLVLFIRALF
jgi:hypothetical protein